MNVDGVLVSVVIPCLNEEHTLGQQLEALAQQEVPFDFEVLVVDNGSTDQTRRVASSYAGSLSLVVIDEARKGRQFACNRGAALAAGSLLVFVDGDDVVEPGFLASMAQALNSCPLVAGELANDGFSSSDAFRFGPARSQGLMTSGDFLPHASGACTGIRKEVYDALGGYDADASFCEDADLSYRAQLAGYEIGVAGGAVVRYRQRSSYRAMLRQHRNYGKATVWLYRRYKSQGMDNRGWRAAVADWLMLMRSLPYLRDHEVRMRWTRRLGRNMGYALGSVTYKCVYL